MKATNELTISRVARFLFAAPLMLCVLLGFVVCLPLWLASRLWGMSD